MSATRSTVISSVLLPVEKVLRRQHLEGVALDGRAAVGRRAQPHLVRREVHRAVEAVAGAVVEGDLDCHWGGVIRAQVFETPMNADVTPMDADSS
jgi:hypothetical protein